MNIKLDMETKKMMRVLGKSGNRVQVAAANAINEAAGKLEYNYRGRLKKKQTIRTKFTTNAPKTFKATPVRRSGEPRPLHKINAITGVRKMKGGEDHYLKDLELGNKKRGNPQTMNKVPVPLTRSRTSNNPNKPVAGANRLQKNKPQILRAGGRKIGVKNDRRSYGDKWKSPSQRFAALYRYKKRGGGTLQGDLSKPFYFIDKSNDLGIFKFMRNKLRKIRSLSKSSTKTKASPNFKKAVADTKPSDIQKNFVKQAQKELGKTVK